MKLELSQAKKQHKFFLEKMEVSKRIERRNKKEESKDDEPAEQEAVQKP